MTVWTLSMGADPALGQSVLNDDFLSDQYINISKTFALTIGTNTPSNFDSDGYPSGVLVANYTGAFNPPYGYYGRYRLKWTGTSAMTYDGKPTIFYSGSSFTTAGTATIASASFTVAKANPNPDIEFAFGVLLTSVATSGGGLVQFGTAVGALANFSTGDHFKLNTPGLGTGPNGDGSWTITKADAQTFTLDASSAYAGLVSITAAGGPGVQSEAIYGQPSGANTVTFLQAQSGAVTHAFSDLIFCKSAEYADLVAGKHIRQEIIDFLIAYKPRYLRTMDPMATQGIYANFSQRTPVTSMIWQPARWIPDIYCGTTGGTGAAFTASAPPGGFSLVNGASVHIKLHTASVAGVQTLNVNSTGAKRLYNNDAKHLFLTMTGTVTDTDVVSIAFGASYFPGSSYTFTYEVNTGATTCAGSVSGTTATISSVSAGRLTVGQRLRAADTTGRGVIMEQLTGATGGAGTYRVALLGATNGTVTNATGAGGSADTSLSAVNGNMVTCLSLDNTLAVNGFIFGNSGGLYAFYIPTKGALTVTASTSGAGTEVCTPTGASPTLFLSGNIYTFVYSAILDGYVATNSLSGGGGLWAGVPFETYTEKCTRANVGLWVCGPCLYTQASYTALGAWAGGGGVPAPLPVVCEVSNEVWNLNQVPGKQATALGMALGFTGASGSDTYRAPYAWYGLNVCQQLPAFKAGFVGAGGDASRVILDLANWALDGIPSNPTSTSMVPFRWNGVLLSGAPASFTGAISGATLTVTSCTGAIFPGMVLSGSGVTVGTKIVRTLNGAYANGTYELDTSQTVSPAVAMTVANPIYSSIGGPDGAAYAISHNVSPNRPIDTADEISYAIYYSGALVGWGDNTFTGTQSFYNSIFQAGADYAAGNTTAAFDAFDADIRTGTRNGVNGAATLSAFFNPVVSGNQGISTGFETFCAAYDGARPVGKQNLGVSLYELGQQLTLASGSSPVSDTLASTVPATLNTRFTTTLSWTLSPTYAASNLIACTNITDAFIAYINTSSQFQATALYAWTQFASVHAARSWAYPGTYRICGASTLLGEAEALAALAPLWAMMPASVINPARSKNYDAHVAYNNA